MKATMEQAKTTKDKTVDSKKGPFDFEADGKSHLPIERFFSMSQLQNLAVVYFDNHKTEDRKKVFDKRKKN